MGEAKWDIDINRIKRLKKPCVAIKTTNKKKSTFSKFGGIPHTSTIANWPINSSGKPLIFIAQIDGNEIDPFWDEKNVLENKRLFLFLSNDFKDFRFNSHSIHAVVVEESSENVKCQVEMPNNILLLKEKSIIFSREASFPSYQHWLIESLNLSYNDINNYDEYLFEFQQKLTGNFLTENIHKLFGYSDAIQGDTNYSWAENYIQKRLESIDPFELQKDFELLLQINLEEDLFQGLWGGSVYFGFTRITQFSLTT